MDTSSSRQNAPLPAGIYARISDSKGDEDHLGIARQVKDCTELAAVKGWTIVETYPEPDVSATRSKAREQYERMLGDIRSGRIKAVIVWDVDRLTRTPRELEDLIDLADEYGLALASVGGEIDLAQPQGRMTARIKGTVARHETDQLSRRVRRKLLENAGNGQVHAPEAYGYRRVVEMEGAKKVKSYDVIDPVERAVLVEAARKILGGQSLRSVCADLNRRGVPGPHGGKWLSSSLRGILVRERNVAKRIHHGEVIGDAMWKPLWDQDTHDRLVAHFSAPDRGQANYRGKTLKYLLSGIARCGKCGGQMTGRPHGDKPPAYQCRDNGDVGRGMAEVDRTVEKQMIKILQRPGVLDHLVIGDPAEVESAKAARDAAKARMDLAAVEFAHERMSMEQLALINSICMPKVEAAQAIIRAHHPVALPTHIVGPDAEKRWAEANLEQKRSLIRALITVRIMPAGRGNRRVFDPSLVVIEPVKSAR